MGWRRRFALGLIVCFVFSSVSVAYGTPSGGVMPPKFTQRHGDWYDSFGFDRNYYGGSDGFLPNVAYETIGANKELAYSIGDWFKAHYPDRVQRAEAILAWVQRWTNYGYDVDNVQMDGVYQEDFAWNADEMAHRINSTTNSVAVGDCEDMAFLSSTIYIAAGFEVTLVSPPSHVALMIWLPEYSNANYYWDLSDGRGEGWIWVEATGKEDPLGWTPPDFTDGNFDVYPLNSMISNINYAPQHPKAGDNVTVTVSVAAQGSPISQVQLHYSVDGGGITTLDMTHEGSSYKATMPGQADGAAVEFYISVSDTQGVVSESGKFSYSVGGGLGIPGFPFESIVIGLAIGLLTLYLLQRRKSALSVTGNYA
jgi:hypothetical protein